MGRFWKKHKEKFWAPFEVLMLLMALMAPVLFSDHSSLKSAVFKNLSLSTQFMDFSFDSPHERNIASTIVEINPSSFQKVHSSIVTDRQVRFESLIADKWEILELERMLGTSKDADWELIPLIFDKNRSSTVSTFIELDPGKNHFRVKYRDEQGVAREMSMIVTHVRKDTQD